MSGRRYYFNETTGENTFTRPSHSEFTEDALSTAAAHGVSEGDTSEDEAEGNPAVNIGDVGGSGENRSSRLPDGWESVISRSTGQRYFVNTLT